MKSKLSELKQLSGEAKDSLIRWVYLVIVVAASITLLFLFIENKQLVTNIQEDRKQLTYDLCLDQNARHDELIQFLKENDAATETTKTFVELLAPKRNCVSEIVNRFGSPPAGVER